jgi:hypothetical protein
MSTQIRTLSTQAADFAVQLQQVLHWSAQTDAAIESQVTTIVEDVRKRGDAAVLEYTQRFDALHATEVAALEITQQELQAALQAITPAQRHALEAAAQRVRDYHERQLQACGLSWQYRDEDGTLLGQKVTPLDRVGIYVPGGKAAYPSSVLMNAGAHTATHTAPAAQPIGACCSGNCRCRPCVYSGWCPGYCGIGLWHCYCAQGRQNYRPGQCLCSQRQAPRVWPSWYRHDCRPERDFDTGRR